MTDNHHLYEAQALAAEILNLSRNTLAVHLRFLQPALWALEFQPDPETTLATDGSFLYYQFYHILRSYKIQKELVTRDCLHTVLHCIYHHPFVGKRVNPELWNLSCDIAVEAMITQLHLPDTLSNRAFEQKDIIRKLEKELPFLSAESVYRYLKDAKWDLETLHTIRGLFEADDHHLWYELTQSPDRQDKKPFEDSSDSSDSRQKEPENAQGEREKNQEQEDSADRPRPAPDSDQ